jgi:hypothetical protein
VDWRSTGERIWKAAQERAAVAKRNVELVTGVTADPPRPKPDEAWCRSISHYDGQLKWCLQALRDDALKP